ncbi:Z1 domain-containing protein [Clostridium perfringens]|uniref:Z1 domain-containing protein n=1 Tax=Clostridium perfringens TaxID=1502 RepID=UPI001F06C707|nr:Z1 domain-containing protein [Clostridium perfringens]MDM0465192.1 Z1 domain-containing protein [Clostridium perfringens]MDM0476390.1 Z1 domain-containing protein [Clostridium perfringens]MDM0485470.1 Z1 domain-containing protein [Clostridium perfringens]
MNKLQNKLYNVLTAGIMEEEDITDVLIDEQIDMYRQLPIYKGLIDEEIKDIRNKILSEQSVRMSLGTLLQEDYNYEKWFLNEKANLDMKYWERYKKYLIHNQGFANNVVNTMDDMLDNLVDLLGNPNSDCEFKRRGLIVGDVQSGKTSNYTGLICKAADAGYKAIVVLTGTIENLRKQTQLRLDEGFVGRDSAAMLNKNDKNFIGVGKWDSSITPMVLTSTMNDFKISVARSLGFDLNILSQPVLFVIKKNVSSLKNLNSWLRTFNQIGQDKINQSLLVIDDEADNASVNTNSEDNDPTSINKQIRTLLGLFSKSSYVGFTATPFANIFIDPNTDDEMLNGDLFPKDYIYSLNAPSNYIGARDIFGEDGKCSYMLQEIDKELLEECLPTTHKRDYFVEYLTDDLKEAICTFLVANAIRDLRGDLGTHRSMLINISRFNDVQQSIESLVNDYLKHIQDSVKAYGSLSKNEALKDNYIKSLKYAYDKQYSNCEFTWGKIQKQLAKSIIPVKVFIVNQKSKVKLNYEENDKDGLRAIAIGGLSLSRGLTLEGLMTSYFCRNSKTYDTLMQMGRWFGYRKNYDDLCRIWMTDESIEWYRYISNATDELRDDIKRYENTGLTPKDFGLKVRSDINTLLVTARNKMRTADTMQRTLSLSGKIVETPYLYSDFERNRLNKEAVEKLLVDIKGNKDTSIKGKSILYRNVEVEKILDLLRKIDVSVSNVFFDTDILLNFISENINNGLSKWDLVVRNGESKEEFKLDNYSTIKYVERSFSLINGDKIVKLNSSRLGSADDGKFSLDKDKVDQIINRFKEEKKKQGKDVKSVPQYEYFKDVERNPLMIIYMVKPKVDEKDKEYNSKVEFINKYKNNNECLVGFSIGIPELFGVDNITVKYTINKIQQILNEAGQFVDLGEDE